MLRIAIISFMLTATLTAQTTIRLGTLAPRNSRWHQLLNQMGDKWKEASGGTVLLKIYPSGEQGDEPEMVQKMRIHALQAVAISGAGLSGIDGDSSALQIPLMYDSWDELDYVRDHISARLEKGLAARGFVVLNWGDTGWVRLFTKKPASSPDELKQLKLCVLQGDATTFELYKRKGFQPVSLAATDILMGLKTGLIDAFQAPPAVALGSQWFGGAKNMLDIKFAPLTGATLVSKDAWDKIPPDTRKKLLEISLIFGPQIRDEIHKLEDTSIALMQGFGLVVVKADDKSSGEWRSLIEGSLWPSLRGGGMPADLFDQVKRLRDDYRKAHSGAKAVVPAKANPQAKKK